MLEWLSLSLAVIAFVVSVGLALLLWYAFRGLAKAMRDLSEPRVDQGELVFDDNDAKPEIYLKGSGQVSFIDSQGVLRTDNGRYDPLAGAVVVTEPSGSLKGSAENLAKVIDLPKRQQGVQPRIGLGEQ